MAKRNKTKKYKNVDDAFSGLVKKKYQKKILSEAQKRLNQIESQRRFNQSPVGESLRQVNYQQIEALKRNRALNMLGSEAERLELEALSINEVPYLYGVERQRQNACTPPNRFLIENEREVTDSFPK